MESVDITYTPSLDTDWRTLNPCTSDNDINDALLGPARYQPTFLTWTSMSRDGLNAREGLLGRLQDKSYHIIPVSSSARNLGFIFDSDMSFTDQINSLSKSCRFYIRDIRRIRHLLPLSAATALANSLVSSKLDYCYSL